MKKLKKIQIFRFIIQIIMFFLLPGLYAMTFSELKQIYKMILAGNFNFVQAFPGLFQFTAVILFTIFMGRVFCGWFCAFGTYNDWVYLVSKKIFKTGFKMNENIDSALKYVKYMVLLVILVVTCTMGSTLLSNTSPWDAFAQIADFSNVLTNLTIGFILLVLITIGAFFVERFFCRYLCPLGAVFNLISKTSIFKIKKPSDKCGKCRICTNHCSMGLKLYKSQDIRGGDCINCLKCVEECPRKNTRLNALGQDMNPALASSFAIATFAGIYGVSSLGGTIISQSNPDSSKSIVYSTLNTSTQKYKDGTYTGTGTGFRGGTTEIELTIRSGRISNISTISHEDTSEFYKRAFDTESKDIISSQSASVDTVSGATYSSIGIISAVQDALSKALVSTVADNISNSSALSGESSTKNDTASQPSPTPKSMNAINSSPSAGNTAQSNGNAASNNKPNNSTAPSASTTMPGPTSSPAPSAKQQGTYKDGTYTGAGTGFRGGTTKISVTISGGRISALKTILTHDTPNFYNYAAKSIISKVLSSQSTSVDTVSGATYSSNGIINAVKDALSKAV